ncbi:hypothetical protein K0M31_002977 [Melipona bicolor]|uniref:Uncharacterized protein n=1 Tax=Melipona bicolor TaxID=60889 RepID=A0AA40KQ45_9HYME|nr:hypothetical protein K0M31_002977 [Melipona bicolor]
MVWKTTSYLRLTKFMGRLDWSFSSGQMGRASEVDLRVNIRTIGKVSGYLLFSLKGTPAPRNTVAERAASFTFHQRKLKIAGENLDNDNDKPNSVCSWAKVRHISSAYY